jgi:hypothetical protein
MVKLQKQCVKEQIKTYNLSNASHLFSKRELLTSMLLRNKI